MTWPFLLTIIPLLRSTRIDLHCAIFQTLIGFLIQHLCIVCVFTLCPTWLVGAPAPPHCALIGQLAHSVLMSPPPLQRNISDYVLQWR